VKKENEPEIRIIQPGTSGKRDEDALRGVEQIAKFLDSRFVIPGTNIRFGLDPILSLFPVLGDFVTFFISSALIYTMYNHGASGKVVIRMMLNATLDTIIGAVPVVGTIFDVFYRSNDRNVRLLKEHYFEGKHQGSGAGILILVATICIIVILATVYGIYKFFEWVF